MSLSRSAFLMGFSILFEAFVLSGLPVLNVVVPIGVVFLSILFKSLNVEGVAIGILVGSFFADIWISASAGGVMSAWIATMLLFIVLKTIISESQKVSGLLLALVFTVAHAIVGLAWSGQLIGFVGLQYIAVVTLVAVVFFYMLQILSSRLSKVI